MASHASGGGGGGIDRGGVVSGLSQTNSHRVIPLAHNLINPELASLPIELDEPRPLPTGWEKFLDLQTGAIYYKMDMGGGWEATVSKKGTTPNMNQLPPTPTPNWSALSSSPSLLSSYVFNGNEAHVLSNRPKVTSMKLKGCPSCSIEFMSSEESPKCPICKNIALLDFMHENISKEK